MAELPVVTALKLVQVYELPGGEMAKVNMGLLQVISRGPTTVNSKASGIGSIVNIAVVEQPFDAWTPAEYTPAAIPPEDAV